MPGGRKGVRRRKQGSSASRAPGETESQREDSRAATSRRGTDGGPGGSGSLAEGGVTRSPPGLERGPRGLKIARGGGSALQLDLVSLPESLSLSVCLASVPPAPRWPRPSRPGLAAEGQGAPPTPGETARPPGGGGVRGIPGRRGRGTAAGVAGVPSGASARPLPQAGPS